MAIKMGMVFIKWAWLKGHNPTILKILDLPLQADAVLEAQVQSSHNNIIVFHWPRKYRIVGNFRGCKFS